MKTYKIQFTKTAIKDIKVLDKRSKAKLLDFVMELQKDPLMGKALVGQLKGFYSLRLNIKDRLVYAIDKKEKTITILNAKTHYGE